MSQINDATLIAALRQQMSVAVARQVAAAGNLANIDTPGYRTKDVTFSQTLTETLAGPRNSTFPSAAAAIRVEEPDGLPARRDGNNVQLDREMLTLGKAAGDFSAAQTALAAKFRLVRYAINEGK